MTSSLAFPEGWLPGLSPGRRGAAGPPGTRSPGYCWARLHPGGHPGQLSGPRSWGTQRQSRRLTLDLQPVVRRAPSAVSLRDLVRARVARGVGSPGFGVSAAQPMPRSAQEPGKCPGAQRGAPPLVTARARWPRRPPTRPHSGAARASLAPAVRAAQSRAERGGAGPRPGPGFPRTRPRGERPRAPPWAARRPGERLVPGPPPTRPDWTRPHHPAIPPWQSQRPSSGPPAKAPRSHCLAQAQEGGGYSSAGSPCSPERGNSAHLRGRCPLALSPLLQTTSG